MTPFSGKHIYKSGLTLHYRVLLDAVINIVGSGRSRLLLEDSRTEETVRAGSRPLDYERKENKRASELIREAYIVFSLRPLLIAH